MGVPSPGFLLAWPLAGRSSTGRSHCSLLICLCNVYVCVCVCEPVLYEGVTQKGRLALPPPLLFLSSFLVMMDVSE